MSWPPIIQGPEGTTKHVVVEVGGFVDFDLVTDQDVTVTVSDVVPEEEE